MDVPVSGYLSVVATPLTFPKDLKPSDPLANRAPRVERAVMLVQGFAPPLTPEALHGRLLDQGRPIAHARRAC